MHRPPCLYPTCWAAVPPHHLMALHNLLTTPLHRFSPRLCLTHLEETSAPNNCCRERCGRGVTLSKRSQQMTSCRARVNYFKVAPSRGISFRSASPYKATMTRSKVLGLRRGSVDQWDTSSATSCVTGSTVTPPTAARRNSWGTSRRCTLISGKGKNFPVSGPAACDVTNPSTLATSCSYTCGFIPVKSPTNVWWVKPTMLTANHYFG